MNVIGRKPVLELLRSGRPVRRVAVVLGAQGKIIGEIIREAKACGVRVVRVPPDRAEAVLGRGNHQGVLAETAPVVFRALNEIGRGIELEYGLLLALDGITDPHHLGAIARSALAAGCDALILPERRGVLPNETAVKASAGTLLNLPVIVVKNLPRALERLQGDGWWVHGAAGGAGTSLSDHDWDDRTVLVVGGEGRGLSRRVGELCDHHVAIPMQAGVESLSASAAASVILFDLARKRSPR